MMICIGCASPLEDRDRFCPHCGHAVQANPDPELPRHEGAASRATKDRGPGRKGRTAIIASLIVAVVAITAFAAFAVGRRSGAQTVGAASPGAKPSDVATTAQPQDPPPSPPHSVASSQTLTAQLIVRNFGTFSDNTSCRLGSSPRFNSGQVLATDESGKTVGVGTIGPDGMWDSHSGCTLPFSMELQPAEFYTFTFGSEDPIVVSAASLAASNFQYTFTFQNL